MRIIKQNIEVIDHLNGEEIVKKLEKIGRVCYKSEELIRDRSYLRFLKAIIDRGHGSVLEHCSITVKATTTRDISHQLVRHRIASYTEQSTRYCNFNKGKFDNQITVIEPTEIKEDTVGRMVWYKSCENSEQAYMTLIDIGYTPDQSRGVLPGDLATEIFITMNIRQWLHVLGLRTSKEAHYQVRELLSPLLTELKDKLGILFNEIIAYE